MTQAEAQKRGNQIKLLILWLVPIGLMAAAGVAYYLVQTGKLEIGSKNYGVLVRPPLQLQDELNNDFDAELWQGKWTMVIPSAQGCDQRCRDALYLTRQIHIRLDKNAHRVQRVFMHAGNAQQFAQQNAELMALFESEHRLLKTVALPSDKLTALQNKLRENSGIAPSFFLVDQQGWAMMGYVDGQDGNEILTDLKHLLKYSRGG